MSLGFRVLSWGLYSLNGLRRFRHESFEVKLLQARSATSQIVSAFFSRSRFFWSAVKAGMSRSRFLWSAVKAGMVGFA